MGDSRHRLIEISFEEHDSDQLSQNLLHDIFFHIYTERRASGDMRNVLVFHSSGRDQDLNHWNYFGSLGMTTDFTDIYDPFIDYR